MFPQLTKYLLQYRQVSIPQIGKFQLVQQPASFDVRDKLINPPTYTVQFTEADQVSDHQQDFLLSLSNDDYSILQEFGKKLKKAIQQRSLYWSGVGTLKYNDGSIQFHPQVIALDALPPIGAERVLRDDVEHVVLQGDTEVLQTATQVPTEEIVIVDEPKEKSYTVFIGWIMVVLLFFFIIYMFVTQFIVPANE